MRRLAVQSRDDAYSSLRDYQTVHSGQGLRVTPRGDGGESHLVFEAALGEPTNTSFIAVGGFVFPTAACEVTVQIRSSGSQSSRAFNLRTAWNRIGVICDDADATSFTVELAWSQGISLDFWGFTGGRVHLPDKLAKQEPTPEALQAPHLAPETFYLLHDTPLGFDIDPERSQLMHTLDGAAIQLKKCSYCSRMLPLDMTVLGSLSFHKHNAKLTNHQNECRACKKWHINDGFNPIRTTDQLHESSVITRERKLFLREPEIIQRIKQRTGAGLKSQVWNRFGRKCFNCGREVKLSEVQLDHTRPLAYLWPMDEHATCLCGDCNNQKKEKFPVDFYSETQLKRLSSICGLPLDQLRVRDLNEAELMRLLDELPIFARTWEARTFAATARKVREMRPSLDLYVALAKQDPAAYEDVMNELRDRPAPVGEDE